MDVDHAPPRGARRRCLLYLAAGLLVLCAATLWLDWFHADGPQRGSDDWYGDVDYDDLRGYVRTVGALSPELTHWFGIGWLATSLAVVAIVVIRILNRRSTQVAALTLFAGVVAVVMSHNPFLAAVVGVPALLAGVLGITQRSGGYVAQLLAVAGALVTVILAARAGISYLIWFGGVPATVIAFALLSAAARHAYLPAVAPTTER